MDENSQIIASAIVSSLDIIEQEREREIVSRRFGLHGNKETLEQIGEMLTITRERVRQLEKAIIIRLRIGAEEGQIKNLLPAEKLIIRSLSESGRISRIDALADRIYGHPSTGEECANIAFLSSISSHLTMLTENDKYYESVAISDFGDEKKIKSRIDEVVDIIKTGKKPVTITELDNRLNYEHPDHIRAIASTSKLLANLGELWGLTKWPAVNPKNIRDKIYVILENHGSPMHFSDIAEAIKNSDFKRKNVTVQAIHNELIKDSRFILIGRGIYALDIWGYKKGTVCDTIKAILTEESPLTREEIIRRVLKTRKVKESTVLLNLQNKDIFEKTGKNSYRLKQ